MTATERILRPASTEVAFKHLQSLHALYECAPGFIATTRGPDHTFTFANASYKRFVGRDNLVGRTVAEALPEIVDQGIIKLLDEVYRTGEPFVGIGMRIKMLNPSTGALDLRCIDVVYQPARGDYGEIIGLFCEGHDVTEKYEAQEAIATLQAQMIHVSRVNALGAMATTLAHELNQPLCAIANYIAGARLDDAAEQPVDQYINALRGIEEASQRAAAIVENLRELTRKREPARTEFDLKLAVEECVRMVQASNSADVRFVDQVAEGLKITADRIKIQQVIINLLVNACEAMQGWHQRVVTISANEEDGHLTVGVDDTGPGLTLEAAETIFSWTDSAKREGMGLGLSICRTIIEQHHGKIWLESSDATGSKFCFSVPQPHLQPRYQSQQWAV